MNKVNTVAFVGVVVVVAILNNAFDRFEFSFAH